MLKGNNIYILVLRTFCHNQSTALWYKCHSGYHIGQRVKGRYKYQRQFIYTTRFSKSNVKGTNVMHNTFVTANQPISDASTNCHHQCATRDRFIVAYLLKSAVQDDTHRPNSISSGHQHVSSARFCPGYHVADAKQTNKERGKTECQH
ncbi:hypothetical protein VTN49DRAFT_3441 [Thermomyces lanuginosus]|uniref:uncharacterized protein n=1 Tax=Thermomyces lanuginosus TaxID=5541 RepID=UPI003742411A